MTTVGMLLAKVEKISINDLIQDTLYDTRTDYVHVQQDQLKHGLRQDGSIIGKYKNPAYASLKERLGSVAGYGNINLYLTGDFNKGVFAEVRDEGILAGSIDSKALDLEDRYGSDIFGLNDEYRVPFVDVNRELFLKKIINGLQ